MQACACKNKKTCACKKINFTAHAKRARVPRLDWDSRMQKKVDRVFECQNENLRIQFFMQNEISKKSKFPKIDEFNKTRRRFMSTRARNFLLTIFDTEKFQPGSRLDEHSSYEVYQEEECPETGRRHLQVYLEYAESRSFKQMHERFPRCHVEARRGSQTQAIAYCTKPASRRDGPWTFGRCKSQGSRTDMDSKLEKFRELGNDVAKFAEEEPWFYVRFNRGLSALSAAMFKPRSEKPSVRWFWGPTGTGKTRTAIGVATNYYIHPCNSRWFDGYAQQPVCIFDDVRGDVFKFSEWLRILDRYPHRVEYKGGMIEFNSPEIIITCPFRPEALFKEREDMNQLLRRIDEIKFFDGEQV